MVLLFIGLTAVLVCFALILADMERRRRRLDFLLDRLEPLVDPTRRLHLRNLRGLNDSLLYAYNLLENLEREVAAMEQDQGVVPQDTTSRFSLRPGRRYRDLETRIAALASRAAATGPTPAAGPGPGPGAESNPAGGHDPP